MAGPLRQPILVRPPSAPLVCFLVAGIAALCLGSGVFAADDPAVAGSGLVQAAPLPLPQSDAPASEAAARVRQLEQEIEQLAATNRQQQEAMLSLRQRLASAQSASSWVPLLGIGFGSVLLIAGSLGLQLYRVSAEWRRAREEARLERLVEASDGDLESASLRSATAPSAVVPTPAMPEPPTAPTAPAAVPRTSPAPRIEAVATQATAALPGTAAAREVSVEEMLDLEQQADFFVALGQDEAAIDLLMGLIRGGGGARPMPYLKLLELYRRRSDAEAYARLSDRFNLRFNAVTPPLEGDFEGGRDLEQYEAVLERLVKIWVRPADAASVLDEMLAHRGTADPFELPAFRDLVLLSAIAHDLAASVPPEAPKGVDLLLPLDARGEARKEGQKTVRAGLSSRLAGNQALPPELMSHLLVNRERYSGRPSTLDLDLTDFSPAPREFTRPASFTDVEQREDGRPSDMGGLDDLDPSARKQRR